MARLRLDQCEQHQTKVAGSEYPAAAPATAAAASEGAMASAVAAILGGFMLGIPAGVFAAVTGAAKHVVMVSSEMHDFEHGVVLVI
jgi:phospholipase C